MRPVTAAFSSYPKQRCPVDAISREVSNCQVNADFKQNVPCWSNFHTGEPTSSDCSFDFLSQAEVPCWYNARERSSNPKWLRLIVHLPIIPHIQTDEPLRNAAPGLYPSYYMPYLSFTGKRVNKTLCNYSLYSLYIYTLLKYFCRWTFSIVTTVFRCLK